MSKSEIKKTYKVTVSRKVVQTSTIFLEGKNTEDVENNIYDWLVTLGNSAWDGTIDTTHEDVLEGPSIIDIEEDHFCDD